MVRKKSVTRTYNPTLCTHDAGTRNDRNPRRGTPIMNKVQHFFGRIINANRVSAYHLLRRVDFIPLIAFPMAVGRSVLHSPWWPEKHGCQRQIPASIRVLKRTKDFLISCLGGSASESHLRTIVLLMNVAMLLFKITGRRGQCDQPRDSGESCIASLIIDKMTNIPDTEMAETFLRFLCLILFHSPGKIDRRQLETSAKS